MRSIIIGASGVIGSALYQKLTSCGAKVVGTYANHPEQDLIHFDMKYESILSVLPNLSSEDIVYILSAYSNPSWIFAHQEEARTINIVATKKLIDAAASRNARVIFMSSVEVFDGKKGGYAEDSEANPLNLYGRMKLEIEDYLKSTHKNHCTVRTGWNVGWSQRGRCVIELTFQTLALPEARMAFDNCFSLIDAQDTAEGLAKLGPRSDISTCHLSCSDIVYRTDLADKVISLSKYGNRMRYTRVRFSELQYSEPRARENHLDNSFSVEALGMQYRRADDIIERKVRYLDSLVDSGKLLLAE